jgi:hypothetical protein
MNATAAKLIALVLTNFFMGLFESVHWLRGAAYSTRGERDFQTQMSHSFKLSCGFTSRLYCISAMCTRAMSEKPRAHISRRIAFFQP